MLHQIMLPTSKASLQVLLRCLAVVEAPEAEVLRLASQAPLLVQLPDRQFGASAVLQSQQIPGHAGRPYVDLSSFSDTLLRTVNGDLVITCPIRCK